MNDFCIHEQRCNASVFFRRIFLRKLKNHFSLGFKLFQYKWHRLKSFVPILLLCWRVIHGIHDAGGHLLDEGHGAADDLTPLLLLLRPDDVSSLLPVNQAVIAPNVLDVVELADLREGADEGFCVLIVSHPEPDKHFFSYTTLYT